MPKIGNPIDQTDIPCERCGSKRKIGKVWVEKIRNDHSVLELRHTQIICTNKDCQSKFDKLLIEEASKREEKTKAKLDADTKRAEENKTRLKNNGRI